MENLTAILYEIDDIRLEQTPIPEPGKDQVLLKMDTVGICGSDVHYWTRGRIGDFVLESPMVLGHEASGIVSKCGENVKNLKPGDRVAIEPGIPCRRCNFCKSGRYNLCPDIQFCATPPVHGNLSQYYAQDADFCFRLPDNMTMEEGALMEPLSVAVHACRRAEVTLGKRVLVSGAGPIGLLNLLTAKAMGATEVVITDIDENRLKLAKNLGADHTYLVRSSDADVETMAKEIADLFSDDGFGRGSNITIECSGAESGIKLGILGTKSGGTLVLVGLGPPEVTLPIVNAAVREVNIKGIFRYANCYPAAIDLVASGKIDVKPLITHRFSLKETVKAFETSKTGEGGAIKVMIKCNE